MKSYLGFSIDDQNRSPFEIQRAKRAIMIRQWWLPDFSPKWWDLYFSCTGGEREVREKMTF